MSPTPIRPSLSEPSFEILQTTQLLAATGRWWLHSGHLHFKCSNKLAITQEHSLLRYCTLHLLKKKIHVLKQEFSVGLF